jgi:hypothetical protein
METVGVLMMDEAVGEVVGEMYRTVTADSVAVRDMDVGTVDLQYSEPVKLSQFKNVLDAALEKGFDVPMQQRRARRFPEQGEVYGCAAADGVGETGMFQYQSPDLENGTPGDMIQTVSITASGVADWDVFKRILTHPERI